MSTLQKLARYDELVAQMTDKLARVETEAPAVIVSELDGMVDELVATKTMVNGRVAAAVAPVRKVAKSKAEKKTPTVSKATKVFDAPGKVKKECPACHKFVAARTMTCPACTHAFETAVKAPQAPKAEGEVSQGRRAKGESLADKLVEVLQDAAKDGRRKEPCLDLPEIVEKLVTKGYHSTASEKNLALAVRARLAELVKKGLVLKSEDRKYSIKIETVAA